MHYNPEIEIRPATENDIAVIAEMGARFFEEAQWSDVTEWDHDSICATLRHLIDNPLGILLVSTRKGVIRGMAGGLVHPAYFNMHHLTGQELFWWVEPSERGGMGSLLLDCLELAAAQRGAQTWVMIALDKVRPNAVGAVYKRRGYRAAEHSWIKRL